MNSKPTKNDSDKLTRLMELLTLAEEQKQEMTTGKQPVEPVTVDQSLSDAAIAALEMQSNEAELKKHLDALVRLLHVHYASKHYERYMDTLLEKLRDIFSREH